MRFSRILSWCLVYASAVATRLVFGECSEQSQDAINAAIRRGDYVTAWRLVEPLAKERTRDAEYDLAFMYAYGKGVAQDYVLAARAYRKAADQRDHQERDTLN